MTTVAPASSTVTLDVDQVAVLVDVDRATARRWCQRQHQQADDDSKLAARLPGCEVTRAGRSWRVTVTEPVYRAAVCSAAARHSSRTILDDDSTPRTVVGALVGELPTDQTLRRDARYVAGRVLAQRTSATGELAT